jgi:hypothetical protein
MCDHRNAVTKQYVGGQGSYQFCPDCWETFGGEETPQKKALPRETKLYSFCGLAGGPPRGTSMSDSVADRIALTRRVAARYTKAYTAPEIDHNALAVRLDEALKNQARWLEVRVKKVTYENRGVDTLMMVPEFDYQLTDEQFKTVSEYLKSFAQVFARSQKIGFKNMKAKHVTRGYYQFMFYFNN